MDRTGPDLELARQSLQGAGAAMRQLLAAAAPGSLTVSANQVRGAAESAVRALGEVDRALTTDDSIGRIACRFCGRQVMSAASLCGFCWRRLDPKPSV